MCVLQISMLETSWWRSAQLRAFGIEESTPRLLEIEGNMHLAPNPRNALT